MVLLLLLLLLFIIAFTQDIYNHMPLTNHVSKVCDNITVT